MLTGKSSLAQGITLDMVFAHGMVMMSEVTRFEEQNSESQEAEKSIETHEHNIPHVSVRWPWGSHHTELLGHLEAAALEFWRSYDPQNAKATAPKNDTVIDWLKSRKEHGQLRKVSDHMAQAIASILRPNDLPTGPRK